MPLPFDPDPLTLDELLAVQRELDRAIRARFERPQALLFTDVVGSTHYIAQHGDVAGRSLLGRHAALVEQALQAGGARLVDTAGDGAFCVADTAATGARVLIALQELILADNARHAARDHLSVRTGLHWGAVLTDGVGVSGEAVHAAARIASSAGGGEIRLSHEATLRLPVRLRMRCADLPPLHGKGLAAPVAVHLLDWRDPSRMPSRLKVEQTGEELPLPLHPAVSIGRLTQAEAGVVPHVTLTLPDPATTRRISRRHISLQLTPDGYDVVALSRAPTVVDGRALQPGGRQRVAPGSTVELNRAVTLTLLSAPETVDVDSTLIES